jgi:hypothetical protein
MNSSKLNNSSNSSAGVFSDIPFGTYLYWNVYYTNLTNTMNFYFFAFAMPIGALSNLLAFVTYSRKRLNKTNIGYFNRWIAFANIITLLFSFMMNSGLYFPFDVNTFSTPSCQFIMYGRKTMRELSPMLEVLFTFDRYLNVVYPSKSQFLKKNRNIFFMIMVITVILLLVNIENLYFYVDTSHTQFVTVDNETKIYTSKSCTANQWITISSDLVVDSFRCFIPVVLMSVFSFLILRKLKQSSKVRSTINRTQSSQESRDSQFTKTLIHLNACFIVFTMPIAIVYIIKDTYLYTFKADLTYFIMNFAWNVAFNFSTIHYVAFFFLNFYFNQLFRRECLTVMFNDSSYEGRLTNSVHTVDVTTTQKN